MHELNFSKILKEVEKYYKTEYNLTGYQCISIALEIQRNRMFEMAHVISYSDKHPTALEKIAIELEEIKYRIEDLNN